MLAALFLASVAVAAFAPVVFTESDAEDAPLEDDSNPSDFSGGDALLGGGETHELEMAEGTQSFPSFDPEVDTVQITGVSEASVVTLLQDTVGFSLSDGETTQNFLFPTLSEVPTDAIDLMMEDSEGGDPLELTVTEMLQDQLVILQPDSGTPSIPTGENLDVEPILPVDSAPSVPTGETLTDDPLQPIVDEMIVLSPLSAGAAEVDPDVTELWLAAEGADPSVADIADFVPGEDLVRVNYFFDQQAEPVVNVTASWDGSDGVVMADGEIVAILRGAPDASGSDVETVGHTALAPAVA